MRICRVEQKGYTHVISMGPVMRTHVICTFETVQRGRTRRWNNKFLWWWYHSIKDLALRERVVASSTGAIAAAIQWGSVHSAGEAHAQHRVPNCTSEKNGCS